MIKLKDILLEGLDRNTIMDIVKRVYPKIASSLGRAKKGTPRVQVYNNVLAFHSGEPNHPGGESEHAEYRWDTNTIYLFKVALTNEKLVIQALLHEYTHATQDEKKVKAARAGGYANNKYERAAKRAEGMWKRFI